MAIYSLVSETRMLPNTVFTTYHDMLQEMVNVGCLNMNVSVSGIYSIEKAQNALDLASNVNNVNFSIPIQYMSKEIVDFCHLNGVKVKTWTADSQDDIDNAYNMGADYIITDYYRY